MQEKPKIELPRQFYQTLVLILRRLAREELMQEAAERAAQAKAKEKRDQESA